MNRHFKKALTAKKKYEKTISEIENDLRPLIEFDFSIFSDSLDGIMLLDKETSNNADLSQCLSIIDQKGYLSKEDYSKLAF